MARRRAAGAAAIRCRASSERLFGGRDAALRGPAIMPRRIEEPDGQRILVFAAREGRDLPPMQLLPDEP